MYPYFKAEDDRWKNSVRHNLSMNPHFRKGGKSKHGAGHQWVLADCDSVENNGNGGGEENDKRGKVANSNDSDECDPAALILSQVRFDFEQLKLLFLIMSLILN